MNNAKLNSSLHVDEGILIPQNYYVIFDSEFRQ